MTVNFNDPFNAYYDIYSVRTNELDIPAHLDRYLPVNQDDAACLGIYVPSIPRGSKLWTKFGKWITIGLFRDEGREPALQPPSTGLGWTRVGNTLTISDVSHLKVGDRVNLYNLNLAYPLLDFPVSAATTLTFSIQVPALGPTSGVNGAWQHVKETNFYEERVVFRLLPSFKLVPYQDILDIFDESAPDEAPPTRSIYNVTTASQTRLPTGKSSSTNYDLPRRGASISDRLTLRRRFNQAYDETGTPLPLKYLDDGREDPVNRVDSPYKNEKILFNTPVQEEIQYGDDPTEDERIYVYDFYGLDLNDPTRGPYFASNIIQRDIEVPAPRNNIARRLNNSGDPIYPGKLFDNFGNRVVGIQENNALLARSQILPIALDSFNRPVGTPVRRRA